MTKEHPILFSASMVRALLDGSKTQTRRVVKPAHLKFFDQSAGEMLGSWNARPLPYGQPGDQLWVRETFKPIYPQDPSYNNGKPIEYDYAATYKTGDRLGDSLGIKPKWKPSIFMPRAASRLTLRITGLRVERLQDISEADALAEGLEQEAVEQLLQLAEAMNQREPSPCREIYKVLWEKINGSNSWAENPWVWVIEFKVLRK